MLQSVIFPKALFDKKRANIFLKEHKINKLKPLHEALNTFRARISEPNPMKTYYSVTLPNGAILILQKS